MKQESDDIPVACRLLDAELREREATLLAQFKSAVIATEELRDGYLPPLKTVIDGPDQYDFVFVGFPTWDMKLPPPMKSFLHQYSFRGKTIIPFNTNGGYGPGSTFQTVRELCPQSTALQGFSTRGGLEKDGQLLAIKDARAEEVRTEVENWLRTVGMLK
jgi:hypothetical protein